MLNVRNSKYRWWECNNADCMGFGTGPDDGSLPETCPLCGETSVQELGKTSEP